MTPITIYLRVIVFTPWILLRFLFDIVTYLLPWMRPATEWSLQQAVRVRAVRLVLLYWSLLRRGDRLRLDPGQERNRFEIIQTQPPKFYLGPLYDVFIRPELLGATWTPSRPTLAEKVDSKVLVALHFHGGGFVIGDGRDHDTGFLARTFVEHLGCTHVCTPQYRLASHRRGEFPAPLQDAVTAYVHLLEVLSIPSSQIILSGDSAGGNMVLGLLRYINDYGPELGVPAPRAVALWSPWVDVSAALLQDIKQSPNYQTDYLNAEFGQWGAMAVSASRTIDPAGPYLSPLHHPFKLDADIPMFVNAGEREVLCHDIKEFSKRFQDCGWRLQEYTRWMYSDSLGTAISALRRTLSREYFKNIAVLFFYDRILSSLQYNQIVNTTVYPGYTTQSTAAQLPSGDSSSSSAMAELDFDVIIIGAGISGINAAYRIQHDGLPGMKYAILESRNSIGGTWDLFRYPGIRSDSDIFTFGFPWSPWEHKESLATGDQIKDYLTQSAQSVGIDRHIRYRHKVEAANWSSTEKNWMLTVDSAGEEKPLVFRSRFLLLGTGYYDYDTPLQTSIPGIESFQGKVIHPQFWPEDYDYTGKDVVIIGSGATAVTILPSITGKAKSATMLQRSPGYIFSLPSSSFLTRLLFTILPATMAQSLNRLIWLFRSYLTTALCRSYPELAKKIIKRVTVQQLPPDIKWDPNFNPRYNPWEQRFCACMNGDFFAALRSGKANVVTAKIKTVTQNSIELESGAALHPDVIVTATGLKLKFGGGIHFSIDGLQFNVADKFAWKAAMLQDVPNLLFMTGYETASWTLGADVSAQLFTRLLRLMDKQKVRVAVPKLSVSEDMPEKSMMSLTSTYVRTAGKVFPKGGTGQWSPKSNYFKDIAGAKWGDVTTDLILIPRITKTSRAGRRRQFSFHMANEAVAPGNLGNLAPEQERKLQQMWIQLLRICGVESLNDAGTSNTTPEMSDGSLQRVDSASPGTFRRSLWSFILSEHPDALVLRFLRARKWDIEKAMTMLMSAITWREERAIGTAVIHTGENVALEEEQSQDDKGFMSQYRSGKSYVRGTDKEHRPIYIIKVRLHDPHLQSSAAMESYILHNIESIRILIKPPNDKCCLLFDLTAFGLKNMDFHVVKFLISVFEARYPETLGLVLIHNAPFVFWGIWNMIKGWLDPIIASKVNFTRNTADLLRFIPEENLQADYGGNDSWEYKYADPEPDENVRLSEEEKRAKIQEERDALIQEFERQTVEWASVEPKSIGAQEREKSRSQLAELLSVNYWKLDPYIRARTYYHRVGVVDDTGHVDFKAA
ncbi:hypothetical protein SUNI508_00780 [Seiridium unicorne]|uniref:CRAL-TRIO domain-containing protein n=1 Tax=Seiridium unicorne TaxID=138068 RepID=A0ABR2V281_9PEZI